ncbi:MAG: NAD(+) synthase [Syntrophomonadaceae bacterium]|nr:NAD(+) synthase [Syntrophomonadaceae bacterium]
MNTEAVVQYLVDWLRDMVNKAGAKGIVFGVSGGIDSAVAGVLAKKAFPDNCLGLILPCETSLTDLIHSKVFVEEFNIDYKIIELDTPYNILSTEFDTHFGRENSNIKFVKANIKPRLRMITMYYAAQTYNYLVLGTTNKSELKVGYSTKYGDSGVDLQVLGDLVKREVYELARYLKIPDIIIDKAPSAGLWEGQTDEKEMGINYDQLDSYIETGEGSPEVIKIIETLFQKSEHKRRLPPIPIIPSEMR